MMLVPLCRTLVPRTSGSQSGIRAAGESFPLPKMQQLTCKTARWSFVYQRRTPLVHETLPDVGRAQRDSGVTLERHQVRVSPDTGGDPHSRDARTSVGRRTAGLRASAPAFALCLLILLTPALYAAAPAIPPENTTPEELLSFFQYPRTPPTFTVRLAEVRDRYLIYSVTYPSWVRTEYPSNNEVPAFYYQPRRTGKVPAIVMLHSYGTRGADVERKLCAHLAEQGIACFLPFLPYHGPRTPPGHESGQLMISGDVERTIQAVRQAVIDVRVAVDWLQARPEVDPHRIGCVGISLGGILAHLVMGIDTRFVAGVAILGGGQVADLMWTSVIMARVRAELERNGLTISELRRRLRVIEPITYAGFNRPRHVLMVEGRYDIVVPPRSARAMWRALGEPPLVWLDTGHYGATLISSQLSEMVAAYLLNQFGERQGPLPRVEGYTIKVGLLIDEELGFTPTINVTLLHLGAQGFLDLGLTTGGLRVGISRRLGLFTEVGVGMPIGKGFREVEPYLGFMVVL
jgi:dienelactone hydrolase